MTLLSPHGSTPLFDDDFPPGEQLPRRIEAVFLPRTSVYGTAVRMVVNGFHVGDPLTDNAWEEEEIGYRWHDALHLAHAVCLGWSPIFRGLAKLKRRSNPHLDHVEDGGRAAVADEAIAWATFCRARRRNWFEPDQSVDGDLLDAVQEMTYGLEVARCSRAELEHAIRSGIACMRALWHHNGGILYGDLHARSLHWQPVLATTAAAPSAPPAVSTSAGIGTPDLPAIAGTPA
ncbi:hypothetical protein [Nonomuraea rhizosphaerae]|uniref:hypothetical protein n=1 Tax=Nonomuraea rhizosphaerae TaxID=2665663 RepID=UPI001C606790|nr:hypothetical protein [Nonomuraea rhizosphaerae]